MITPLISQQLVLHETAAAGSFMSDNLYHGDNLFLIWYRTVSLQYPVPV